MKNSINKKRPLVSIAILNYNGAKYLPKTLPPLLKLDYPSYEVIIIDNASQDNSLDIIKSFNNNSLKLFSYNENFGASKGRNLAVEKSNGEYILLLDNDILINKKFSLSQVINAYNSKNNIGFLQIPLINTGFMKTEYYGIFFTIYGVNMHKKNISIHSLANYPKTLCKIAGPAGNYFFKISVWNELGGMDMYQKFHIDDNDMGPRAYLLGYENYLYTKDFFTHLGIDKIPDAKTYAKRLQTFFSGNAHSMMKNYKIENLLINFPILVVYHFFKAIKYSLEWKSLAIFFAFIKSAIFFIKHLSDTLQKRKEVQMKRKIQKDVFLKIKPPKFK